MLKFTLTASVVCRNESRRHVYTSVASNGFREVYKFSSGSFFNQIFHNCLLIEFKYFYCQQFTATVFDSRILTTFLVLFKDINQCIITHLNLRQFVWSWDIFFDILQNKNTQTIWIILVKYHVNKVEESNYNRTNSLKQNNSIQFLIGYIIM